MNYLTDLQSVLEHVELVEDALGCVAKSQEDVAKLKAAGIDKMLS